MYITQKHEERIWKDDSRKLCLIHAAVAESCGAENKQISYLCGNATILYSSIHQMQLVWKKLEGQTVCIAIRGSIW